MIVPAPTTGYRFPDDVPVLTDGDITLRAHRRDDVDAMVEMCRDPTMQQWTNVPPDYTREHAIGFVDEVIARGWQEMNHRGWAIEAVDPDSGEARFAGNIDIRGTPIADVGYALHPWARGRGLMARAMRLAVEWSFADGGTEIVHWRSRKGNVASLRVAWACGFELHGTTPGLLHERGQVLDAWTGSIRFGADRQPPTTWWDVPVLEGDAVRLRPLEERDVPRIVQACRDEATQHWLAELPRVYNEQTAHEHIDQTTWDRATGKTVSWCVADPRTDELLAELTVMHLRPDNPATGEIGYWAHPDARGRGVVTEATRLVAAHALRPRAAGGLGRQRLELFAADGNAASNAIAWAAGFTHVGTRHRAERLGDGSYADLFAYELLA